MEQVWDTTSLLLPSLRKPIAIDRDALGRQEGTVTTIEAGGEAERSQAKPPLSVGPNLDEEDHRWTR